VAEERLDNKRENNVDVVKETGVMLDW